MTANDERTEAPAGPASLRRAASELQLRQNDGAHSPDAASLQDEPLLDDTPGTCRGRRERARSPPTAIVVRNNRSGRCTQFSIR